MRYDRNYGRYGGYGRAGQNRAPSEDYALDYGERVRFTAGRSARPRRAYGAYDQGYGNYGRGYGVADRGDRGRDYPRDAGVRYNSGRFADNGRLPSAGGSVYGGSSITGMPRYYSGVGIGMGIGGHGYTPYW